MLASTCPIVAPALGLETLELPARRRPGQKLRIDGPIKDYPTQTTPGMLDDLLPALPCEMVVTQELRLRRSPTDPGADEPGLRRMKAADDDGLAACAADLTPRQGRRRLGPRRVLASITGSRAWCAAETLEGLGPLDRRGDVDAFTEMGAIAVREDINLEAAFWAQFPGNFKDILPGKL
ncbi:hypothetical protein ACRAWD_04420 [Caulobacter segnis]